MIGVQPEAEKPASRIAIMLAVLAAVVLLFPRRPARPLMRLAR